MKISNFEATGLDKIENFIIEKQLCAMSEEDLRMMLVNCNISFILEGINRLQSTLICELKDSYVQQSQRYVTLTRESYTLPDLAAEDTAQAENLIAEAFDLYAKMSEMKEGEFKGRPKIQNYRHGIPIEDARYILPLLTKTNLCTAMSGDKLVDFVQLCKDKRYGNLFDEILKQLQEVLPPHFSYFLCAQPKKKIASSLVEEYYAAYFGRLNDTEQLVLIDKFDNLDMKVGFGSMTSTMKSAASVLIEKWGAEAPKKAQGVTDRVLSYGHTSVAEQARTTFGMMCSLVTYHQQLRHRLSANMREPLTNLIDDVERPVKVPPTIANSNFYKEYQALTVKLKNFRKHIAQVYGKDKAMQFLLNCDQVKVIVSANARADISMMADRTCMNAQWEIRELAVKKVMELRKLSSILYEKALPSCVNGACREGKMTCGQAEKVRALFSQSEKLI